MGYKHMLDCKQTHEHADECYGWFEANCGDDSHAHTDEFYSKPAEGLLAKFADKRISQLNTIGDTVKELTLADVLDPVPSMLADLADTQIGELGNKLNDMYVGAAMGYVRNEKDGTQYTDESTADGEVKSDGNAFVKTDNGKWYEAELTCKDSHTHFAACYEYVWYTDSTYTEKPTGVNKAFCNYTLSSISNATNELTLAKLGIDTNGNKILDSVKDEKITDIGSKISNLKMGVALGYADYTDKPLCGNASHAHSGDCYGWLEECGKTDCSHGQHFALDGKNYVKVKGLSAKIADKSIADLGQGNAISGITETLTIGDLIDSGMMDIGADANNYKFALLSAACVENTHTFTEGAQTFGCSFQDFMTYSAAYKLTHGTTVTAREYWEKCHENSDMTEAEKTAHRDEWKNATLNEFMNTLLQAIN